MTDKQIIIDGVDVNTLYSEQIACMNRYEVARLFIKTVELLVSKEQECEKLKNFYINLVGVKECEIKELVKYKQALRDIKNIAVGITSTFYKGVEISTTYEQLKQILQKCEVLDE